MIERVTDLVKEILIRDKDIDLAVDMTAGNGNDSAFILDVLGAKELIAFDIQEAARENTLNLLGPRDNFTFILDSHAHIDKYINEKIDLVVYNLGYLPNSDKTITTRADSTIKSLEKVLRLLRKKGRVLITIYPGHAQGKIEADKLDHFLEELDPKDFAILKLSYPNKKDISPYVVTIEKKS